MSTEARTSRPISKRVSTIPAPPKAPTTINPTAIIANHCVLTGIFPITVGAKAVLHPHSRVVSAAGPVEIGEGVIIWERATIGINEDEVDEDEEDEDIEIGSKFIMLERNCIVESGATVAAKLVGEGTTIEAFAKIGEGSVIGKYCKIMPHANIPPNSIIEDFTIVYGQNQRRKDTTAMRNPLVLAIRKATHQKQLTTLQAIIPSNIAKWMS